MKEKLSTGIREEKNTVMLYVYTIKLPDICLTLLKSPIQCQVRVVPAAPLLSSFSDTLFFKRPPSIYLQAGVATHLQCSLSFGRFPTFPSLSEYSQIEPTIFSQTHQYLDLIMIFFFVRNLNCL